MSSENSDSFVPKRSQCTDTQKRYTVLAHSPYLYEVNTEKCVTVFVRGSEKRLSEEMQ